MNAGHGGFGRGSVRRSVDTANREGRAMTLIAVRIVRSASGSSAWNMTTSPG